jgi:hypothetical protein
MIMKRRDFVGNLMAASALRSLVPGAASAFQTTDAAAPDPAVKRVMVMFKCHLDVGFVDTQANIIRRYFEVHFPRAMETAAALRKESRDSYIWTTAPGSSINISKSIPVKSAAGWSRPYPPATSPGTRSRSPGRRNSWTVR